jgi:VWFA-related protein
MRKIDCFVFSVLMSCTVLGYAQQAAVPAADSSATPAPSAVAPAPVHISMDVQVSDKEGKPVGGLEPTDFTLLDDDQPRRILGFRRTDGMIGNKFDLPTEAIIVLDAVNIPYQGVTQLRLQLQRYLRQNGGQLTVPTSVFVYTSQGLMVQPAPSKDGNAIAKTLDTSVGTVRARDSSAGDYGLAEQFQSSIKTIKGIADNEAHKPGRKLLIWLGSGWPLLDSIKFLKSNQNEAIYFSDIVEVSKRLRDARITVDAVFTLIGSDTKLWGAYVKPVKEFHKADAGNLALQVLARQTGGRVIEPSNDVPSLIDQCIADVGPYYTLAFTPPQAAHSDEYHDLKVTVAQPGVTVRNISGYYDQP